MAICSFPGCGTDAYARELCLAHYHQDRRGSPLHPVGSRQPGRAAVTIRVSGQAAERVAADRAGAREALEAWARRVP